MNEKIKRFSKRIAVIGAGIAAFVLGIIIRERNSPDRKRAREIEKLVDAAGDCNKSALDGIEAAERILQKAKKR